MQPKLVEKRRTSKKGQEKNNRQLSKRQKLKARNTKNSNKDPLRQSGSKTNRQEKLRISIKTLEDKDSDELDFIV